VKVYLSGPMEGCTDEEMNGWRQEVVARLGPAATVLIPALVVDPDDFTQMVRRDKRDIDAADYVIANPWKTSSGTSMEVMYAYMRGTPVVTVARPGGYVNPWFEQHSCRIAESVAHACDLVLETVGERLGDEGC